MAAIRNLGWVVAFFITWSFLSFGIGPMLGTSVVGVSLVVIATVWRFRQRS